MGPQEIVDLLNAGGVLAVLVLIIFITLAGLYRGWWVPGPFYKESQARIAKLEQTNDGYENHFKTITTLQEGMKARQEAFEREIQSQLRDILDALREQGTQPPRRGTR